MCLYNRSKDGVLSGDVPKPPLSRNILFMLCCLQFLLIVSCASIPPDLPASNWLSMLPEGASFHVCVREPSLVRALFDAVSGMYGLSQNQVSQIADPTDQAFFSFTDDPVRGSRFTILLIGRFSSWVLDAGFGSSPEWKKSAGAYTVWQHETQPLSVSNPKGYMVVVTNGDINQTLGRIDRGGAPAGFSERALALFQTSKAVFYVPHPASGNGAIPFNREKVPLDEILVTADGNPGARAIKGSFVFSDAADPKVLVTSLRTFVVWIMRKCGISAFTDRIAINDTGSGVGLSFQKVTDKELSGILGFVVSGGK
jgi:hypothetical protein